MAGLSWRSGGPGRGTHIHPGPPPFPPPGKTKGGLGHLLNAWRPLASVLLIGANCPLAAAPHQPRCKLLTAVHLTTQQPAACRAVAGPLPVPLALGDASSTCLAAGKVPSPAERSWPAGRSWLAPRPSRPTCLSSRHLPFTCSDHGLGVVGSFFRTYERPARCRTSPGGLASALRFSFQNGIEPAQVKKSSGGS